MNLARGQSLRGRAAALVGNSDDPGVPLVVQPAQEQIGERAVAERAIVQRVGLGLRQSLKFGDRWTGRPAVTNTPSVSQNSRVTGAKSVSGP